MTADDDAHTNQMNITTGGGDYAGRDIDKRQGVVFVEGHVHGSVIGQQHNYYQAPTTPLDRRQQRNRKAMLQKVKAIWIDGLLAQSLAKELRIALDLTTQPDAVILPLNALVQELNQPAWSLSTGIPIIDVFDQMGGALLILGAPGAGKTTLLLELARDLIARVEQDEGHPIPVVFNLSSWATKRQPLKEWLVEELNTKYDVPRKLAQGWVNEDAILPLLDGLDEVAAEYRAACVQAINAYRIQGAEGLVPLAVCSRVFDYEALATKLRLQGAVVVQPLTQRQVDAYLQRAGEQLAGVRAVLRDDAELREMLDTPLMLSIAALAYAEKSALEVQVVGVPEVRRRHLFDAYIQAMFSRRSKQGSSKQRQTTSWLSWLADRMVHYNQTVYYIERMQPDWLPYRQRWISTIGIALVIGLIGALVGTLVGASVGGLGGLVGGLLGGLGGGAVAYSAEIEGVETLRWRWSRNVLLWALAGCLVLGLVLWLLGGQVWGLVGAVVGSLGVGLLVGLSGSEIETKLKPNQSIRRSVRSALIGALAVGLAWGMVAGVGGTLFIEQGIGLALGWAFGLFGGLVGGLVCGSRTILQHLALRWMLFRNGSLPFRDRDLIAFLDYCIERIFLRKVGGGYIFVHRLLMEHFASLYDEEG
jgi:hypothetical protein